MENKLFFNLSFSLAAFISTDLLAAGCVTSRGAGMPEIFNHHDYSPVALPIAELKDPAVGTEKFSKESDDLSNIDVTLAYRTFRSARHFVGSEEQHERQELGNQVINHSQFYDLRLNYRFDQSYSIAVTLPYVSHDRSQAISDSNRNVLSRFHTQSNGIGDIQVVGSKWLWEPSEPKTGNLQLGLGVSLPTGKDDATDVFTLYDRTTKIYSYEVRHVDQSIQPGLGAYAVIFDLYGYHNFTPEITGYLSGTYNLTPTEKNGVTTNRSNPFEAIMSVPDTYLVRLGGEYLVGSKYSVVVSSGLRYEVVPTHDLVGGSKGFRRPGADLSFEPGISAEVDGWGLGLYVPISIYRNRFKSDADVDQGNATGKSVHGDAAFADFAVTFSVSNKF